MIIMTDNGRVGWKILSGALSIIVVVIFWNFLILLCDLGYTHVDELGHELSNFPTRQVLVHFLITDITDENPYTENYDCVEYAADLRKNARSLGYRVRAYPIVGDKQLAEYNILLHQYFGTPLDMESRGFGHILCKAYIVDEDLWVTIEPQGDLILNCTIGDG